MTALYFVEGAPDECWPWTGSIDRDGYGRARRTTAHRVVYEAAIGAIPPGFAVDHVCHNVDPRCPGGRSCLHRRCVNPAHLEAVSKLVNDMRGKSPLAINARKTHCDYGHPFDERNTYRRPGLVSRSCRACNLRRVLAYQQRRREVVAPRRAS